MAEVVAQQRVAWWPRSWFFGVATQPIRSGSGGVSLVFHIPGPTPSTGTNWKRGVSETSRAAAAPEFLHDGHQPQNWPPLDGISMPSDKTSQTSLWNPHRGKVKGEMEVEFLPTCGAAQEAPPRSNPNALLLYFVWGFWPLAKTGAIPRDAAVSFEFSVVCERALKGTAPAHSTCELPVVPGGPEQVVPDPTDSGHLRQSFSSLAVPVFFKGLPGGGSVCAWRR